MSEEDSSFEARWRRQFNEFARENETDASIAGWSEAGLDTRVRAFLRHWKPRNAGERWLDLGCGAGTYTRLLAEQELDITGADYSSVSLQKARARSQRPKAWVSADARQLPFRDSSFDGIICFGVSQTLSQTAELAAEAARVLKPGGEFWLDALNSACIANTVSMIARRIRGLPAHLRYDRALCVQHALRESGFQTLGIYWLTLAPSRWPMLQRAFDSRLGLTLHRRTPRLASVLSHSFIVHARR